MLGSGLCPAPFVVQGLTFPPHQEKGNFQVSGWVLFKYRSGNPYLLRAIKAVRETKRFGILHLFTGGKIRDD
jgi:hypothetical protein